MTKYVSTVGDKSKIAEGKVNYEIRIKSCTTTRLLLVKSKIVDQYCNNRAMARYRICL